MWSDRDEVLNAVKLKTDREGLLMVLGPLELSIMRAVWELNKPNVQNKEIQYTLKEMGTVVANATVSTTTHRLAAKGYLFEMADKKQYTYTARMSEDELEAWVVEHVLSKLHDQWPDLVDGWRDE